MIPASYLDDNWGGMKPLKYPLIFNSSKMSGSRKGEGDDRGLPPPPPLKKKKKKKSQKYRVSWQYCSLSPKMTKLPSQHSMSGHHRHSSETPFKWRFAGRQMMVLFGSSHQKNKYYKKSRLESDWIVGTEQPSFSGSLVLSMCAATNPT